MFVQITNIGITNNLYDILATNVGAIVTKYTFVTLCSVLDNY